MNRSHLSRIHDRTPRSKFISVLATPFVMPLLASWIWSGAIALPLVLPQVAQAQSNSELLIKRTLMLGDRGADVLQLQRALVDRRLLRVSIPSSQREGYFGPTTEAALKAFQRSERDLVADGVLGEKTFRRLFGVGAIPSKTFSIGLMQAQLAELGYYRGGLDGQFGPATSRSLQDLRDEVFVNVSPREDRLEETFAQVDSYYRERRITENLPARSVLEERVRLRLPAEQLLSWDGRIPSRGYDTIGGGGGAPPRDARSPYRVIIPIGKNPELLWEVRRFVSDAFRQESSRGDYVQAGAYGDRETADARANLLKDRGFDARVFYRD